jgi:hypothetical protein
LSFSELETLIAAPQHELAQLPQVANA